MAASASFLSTCLSALRSTPEYAAFQTALAGYSAAAEEQKQAAWAAAYSDGQAKLSPAHRLRRAARDVVTDQQTRQGVTLSQPDAEDAYNALVAQAAPEAAPPAPPTALTPAMTQEQIDLAVLALARIAGD